jgi:hypothetical protein
MKTFRGMSVLVAAAGALAWGVAVPAGAASTDTTLQAAVSGQVGGGVNAQSQSSSAESQSLTGAVTERITFSGNAVVKANVRQDPDFRTPDIVILTVDLSGISGVGATSRKKYVTTDKAIVQRRLRPSDTVVLSFPFWQSGSTAPGSGPVGNLTLTLSFDVNTRALTAAAGSVTSPTP